jgi:hypothetical protein
MERTHIAEGLEIWAHQVVGDPQTFLLRDTLKLLDRAIENVEALIEILREKED